MVTDARGRKDLEAPIIDRHCLTSPIVWMATASDYNRHIVWHLSAMFLFPASLYGG